MPRRSYRQYCAVARGLDVIGDRWALLIVRELLLGPQRYKDLLAGLPGIGTNLLATRLRELEEAGLARRDVLPPPAGATVYRLTSDGQALEPVITAIGRWGARFLGPPRPDDAVLARPYVVAMRSQGRPEQAGGQAVTFELRIGGLVFEAGVRDGRCVVREGQAGHADAVLTMDVQALGALLLEGLAADAALAGGRVQVTVQDGAVQDGRAAAVARLAQFTEIFAIRAPAGSAPARTR